MGWSEDSLHRWFARWPRPRVLAGSPGHDAAVLREFHGREVACVDQCVEGVHFERRASLHWAGRKAACRALSDLAATAATPRALLLSVCAPQSRPEADLRRLIGGVRSAAREFECELVGGDLCAARGPLHLTVSALGVVSGSAEPVGRARAEVGQRVVLTGPCGGSILGRHLRIRPRLEYGAALARMGATALMDVSDGLALDLFRLARASGIAIELDLQKIPIHRDAVRLAKRTRRAALAHALSDGEDHELIATLAPGDVARARRAIPSLVEIGRVVRGSGVTLLEAGAEVRRFSDARGGFVHGH